MTNPKHSEPATIMRYSLDKHAPGMFPHSLRGGWVKYSDHQATITDLQEEVQRLRVDAERYRHLRMQHWHDSDFCVVWKPKQNVTLGAMCPSEKILDDTIDAALSARAGGEKSKPA